MEQRQYSHVGKQAILDVKLKSDIDVYSIISHVEKAIEVAKMNIVGFLRKQFDPHGDTIVWILSESAFQIHTYPESNFIAFDCFTCGDEGDPVAAMDYLKGVLDCETFSEQLIIRGKLYPKSE